MGQIYKESVTKNSNNRFKSDNYVDGNGDEVGLIFYDTWNDRVLLGITPNEDTLVEFSGLHRDGTIANATIHMDVTDLDRENKRFYVDSNNLTTWLKNVDFIFDHTGGKLTGEFALFYSRIDDFILVHRGDSALNIDAERIGGELNLTYELLDNLLLTGNLAYVYAKNLTRDTPLAQTLLLDGTLGINYTYGFFFGQFKTRFVDRQDRIHKGYGNTLALDSTPTGGFVVSSLQLGYNYKEIVDVKFGIDNLFDKT